MTAPHSSALLDFHELWLVREIAMQQGFDEQLSSAVSSWVSSNRQVFENDKSTKVEQAVAELIWRIIEKHEPRTEILESHARLDLGDPRFRDIRRFVEIAEAAGESVATRSAREARNEIARNSGVNPDTLKSQFENGRNIVLFTAKYFETDVPKLVEWTQQYVDQIKVARGGVQAKKSALNRGKDIVLRMPYLPPKLVEACVVGEL